MGKTIPGGIYKNATGDGYHDASGNPVTPVSEAKAEAAIAAAEAEAAAPVLAATPKKEKKARKPRKAKA